MLIELLISILILCVVLYAVNLLLTQLHVAPEIKNLVWLIIAVIVIIWLLRTFGTLVSMP